MRGGVAFADIRNARERVRRHVHRTPVVTCSTLDRMTGARLYFKCENLQKAGSFKVRGATNAVRLLSSKQAEAGVATHSSGNHGQALALAAKAGGIAAHIVVPRGSPDAKRRAIEEYGGRITLCGPTPADRERALEIVVKETGAVFIHSYDNPALIAGQGTAALELLEDVPDLDTIVAPLGGGGLLSGTAIAAHGVRPGLRVVGAEPELADDAYRSLRTGRVLPPRPPLTVADGLRMPLCERTFAILAEELERVVLVSEEGILGAMRLLWERAKTVVEPSGAAGLAAVLREPRTFAGRKVGIVLSGGNLDLSPEKLPRYFL
ncbi:MAG: pyridoxal-phosphate dependent enzyme [Elusimicrobiota bacterium]